MIRIKNAQHMRHIRHLDSHKGRFTVPNIAENNRKRTDCRCNYPGNRIKSLFRCDGQLDNSFFKNFSFDESALSRQVWTEPPEALVTDNDEQKPKGRLDKRKEDLKELGSKLRETLTLNLSTKGFVRPLQGGMQFNSHGHVYMEY